MIRIASPFPHLAISSHADVNMFLIAGLLGIFSYPFARLAAQVEM
jgi:hypothetical protein